MTMTRLVSMCAVLVGATALGQTLVVPWSSETRSIPSNVAGDPAIARRQVALESGTFDQLFIIGTDAVQNGVYVFNLDGTVAQTLPLGPVNSADVRDRFLFVSNNNLGVQAFALADAGFLQLAPTSFSVTTPGPLAVYAVDDSTTSLWVDTRSATMRRFSAQEDGGRVSYSNDPDVTLSQGASGLAADPRTGQLYVSQPAVGILQVDPNGQSRYVVSVDGGELGAIVGGVAVMPLLDGGAWLFSAAASRDRVVVHEVDVTNGSTFIGSFELGPPDGGASRARSPAFLDLSTVPSTVFPRGLLVVQDGVSANYKIVDLAKLDALFPLPPTWPAADAGMMSVTDAGSMVSDGGTTPDAGVRDGGTTSGGGGGSPRPPIGSDPEPRGCGCNAPSILVLPLLLLWWIRRPRS